MDRIPFAKPPHPVSADARLTTYTHTTSQAELDKLNRLLEDCPLPAVNYENSRPDGSLGISRTWVANAIDYWKNGYDWSKHEAQLNSIPQFKISITGDDSAVYEIHFLALFSEKTDAVPILFLHGWPGSVVEFLPMLLNLKSQYASDPASFPYHIIVPSLIGFGWSSPPPKDSIFHPGHHARLLTRMMAALGFGGSGYVAQGGDVGSVIAPMMSGADPACKLVHVNMFIMPPPEGTDIEEDIRTGRYDAGEVDALKRSEDFWKNKSTYITIQANSPSTVGFAIGSSPLALLSWIGEKMIGWSDQTPGLDLILTNVSYYWFSGCFPTSMWGYAWFATSGTSTSGWEKANVPVGVSSFRMDHSIPPKAWLETTGKVKWHRTHDKGGHFAALERPEALWKDVTDFVEEFWAEAS